ncbi:MAG: four helix bundle protein [Chloroflexota bacterium]|nr:four helix bundle protein [Chloroflexota bacterium]
MGEELNYKDLPVVQRAVELVQAVHVFVSTLPQSPQGRTIGDQLFRAATSIGANIAEGRGRATGKEYERFLRIARASANETDYWLRIATHCGLLAEREQQTLLALVDECLRMLSAMITKLRATQSKALREAQAVYAPDASIDGIDALL